MFQRQVKRHQTPFGVMIHKRGPVGTNLLITKNGRTLGLRYGERLRHLLKTVRLDKQDKVHFGEGVHPVEIGFGQHARVFRLFPAEEAQFLETKPEMTHLIPSLVLKAYRPSVSKKIEPDGFTQFFSNSFVFNWLKNQKTKSFAVRPLSTFFVSERFKIRKFINTPTLEEAYLALMEGKVVSEPLGKALNNDQIYAFLRRNNISFKELERVDSELLEDITGFLSIGAKTGFGTKFNIEPDRIMKNVFVVGRSGDGKLLVSVFDQGKYPIKGLANLMRKGKLFPMR